MVSVQDSSNKMLVKAFKSLLGYIHTYIHINILIYFIVSNHKFITNKADKNRNNNILTWKSNINMNKQI